MNQFKSIIDDMEKKYEEKIEKLKSSSNQSDINIRLLKDELKFVKDDLDRIRSMAQIVPKKKWSKEAYISIQRVVKNI